MKPIADIEKIIHETPLEQLPRLIGELKGLQALGDLRLSVGHAQAKIEPARYLKPEEVAQRWGVPTSFVYEAGREGKLARVKFGKYVRFTEEAVRAFEEKYRS
jgi:excisionase family DNA binding protein